VSFDVLERQKRAIEEEVQRLQGDGLLNVSEQDLSASLADRFR
jgi:hypothetical protein